MDKEKLYSIIEKHSSLLTDLSDRIWEYAELSMQEYRSSDAYVQILKAQGFEVTTDLAGIKTAFSGSYGSGKPVIGILGEYDALSGLSQKPCTAQKEPADGNGNGHGCGHNLLGAASLGAAIAIKEAIAAGELAGTVVFYGCPGEEGCAGKTFMARQGMFRDLDAALCWHPGDLNAVTTGSCAACIQIEYRFEGISAHAAGDPENGRSALDAAELMNIGVQFLREHISKTASVHYCFSNTGGLSPNVVQSEAAVIYMIREKNVALAQKLVKRVNAIAQGAAQMTETTVTMQQIDGTSNTLSNTVMEKLIYQNLQAAPLPEYSKDETAYASALKATFSAPQLPWEGLVFEPAALAQLSQKTQGGTKPINDFVLPYYPNLTYNPGSTDVGDVSWLTPTAQFTAATWVSCSPGHSWQNVSIGKSSIAHKGMLYAAKVLAGTAADLMTQPDIRNEVRKEFSIASAAGYLCPLDETVQIPQ